MSEEVIYKLHIYPSGELEEFEYVQELIRCKECKHWYRAIDESGTIERFNFSECTKGHYGNGLEFYCADGERREP